MSRLERVAVAAASAVFALFVTLPVAAVFLNVTPMQLIEKIGEASVLDPLRLSLLTATASTAGVFLIATPLSYVLARHRFKGKWFLDSLVEIPVVLPPAVAGLALLLAFAPRGLLGSFLLGQGVILPGSIWAVIIAQSFVASPFYFRSSETAFEAVSQRVIDSGRILTKSSAQVFFRITLPLASRGILVGLVMCWARALGEFGATLFFAGNLPGVTQTMPLAIYLALSSDILAANVLSVILVLCSFAVLASVRFLGGWRRQ